MDWPILDIWYKGNHIICSLRWSASFCQHNVSKVHPCYSVCQYFILLWSSWSHYSLFIRSSVDRHLGHCPLSAPCCVKCGPWTSCSSIPLGACEKCHVSGPPPRNDSSESAISQDHQHFKFEQHCPCQVTLSLSCTWKSPVPLFSWTRMLIQLYKWSMSCVWRRRYLGSTEWSWLLPSKMSRLAT